MIDQQDAFAQFLRRGLDDRYEFVRDVPQDLLQLVDQLCSQD